MFLIYNENKKILLVSLLLKKLNLKNELNCLEDKLPPSDYGLSFSKFTNIPVENRIRNRNSSFRRELAHKFQLPEGIQKFREDRKPI